MAENTIDTLSLEIKSNAAQAEQSIKRLTEALVKLASGTTRGMNNLRTVAGDIKSLNNATKGLDTSKLSAYATGMDNLSASVGRFADIGDKIAPAVNALNKLAGVDLAGLRVSGDFSGLSALAEGAGKLSDVAPKLAALRATDLNRSLAAFQKLGQTDFSGVAQSLQALNGLDVSGFSGLAAQALGTFAGSAEKLAALGRKDMNAAIRNIERMGTINFSGLAAGMASLSGVDFSQLASLGTAFQTFSNSLAGADKISNGTARIFNSLALLAQSAGNIPLITSGLQPLSAELQKFISVIASAPAVANETTVLVSALAQMASSGSRIQNVAVALPDISAGIRAFIDSMASAPAVNESIIRLVESLSRFTVQGGRAGAAAGNLHGNFNLLSGSASKLHISINKITNGLKGFTRQLLSLAGLGTGLYALIKVGRESIKTFSDLIEIQNVVDKSFGDMAYKIEELAKVSVPDFGMSELTLKQIASRYQAMGVAMGFTQGQMSDMSIELTKLAADMASFYNVEQKAVAESLESVFTGTTRPLRTYGLDLTQATLQEWALKQGLDANIASMSQAEKTMLRYQYVMAQTRSISGDFKDTQMTMANQVRILKQSFEQLASVIGGALVNAFKPLIVNLNRAMQSIIAFAQTVANALGKIFGWTYEIKGGGVVNDVDAGFGNIEDSTAGTAGNLDEAADNLKKMQKYIADWHEVRNMTTDDDTDSGGSGGSGGGVGGIGSGSGGELVKTEGLFEKYKSEIDNLYELGEYIGKVLTDAMNNIDWDEIYEGARNFGTGLADFLNGLISPELFGAVGRTIAGALNTAIYAALSFGERFDWKDFGLSIATGINEFFKTFDFASLAETINVWAKGILNTVITALGNIDWRMIGTKIGTFLAEIDFTGIGLKLGQALWGAVNGGIIAWENSFKIAPIETTIVTALATLKFTKLGKLLVGKIALALTNAFKDTSVFIALKAGVQALFGSAGAEAALAFMNPITKAITGIGAVLGGITLAGSNFFDMWKNGFDWLDEAFMLLGISLSAVGAVILGTPALVAAAVAGIVAAIGTVSIVVHDNWDAISEWLSGIPEWLETNIILPLVEGFSGMCDSVGQFFSDLWTGIQGIWVAVSGWFSSAVIEPLENFFEGFSRRIAQIFEGLWILVQAAWIVASGWFNDNVIVPVTDGFLWLKDNVSGFFENLWEGIQNIWCVVSGWFNDNVTVPVTDYFRNLMENVYDFFLVLWDGVQSVWRDASDWFSDTVIDPLVSGWETATETVGELFENLWEGIKTGVSAAMNAVIGAVESGCNFIIGSVNDILNGFNKLVSAAAEIAGLDWGGVDLLPEVSLPRVPMLAKGGVVNKATLALIGESGKEAVLPLERNTGWISNLSEQISNGIKRDFGNLQLDYSIPEPKGFIPRYSETEMSQLKHSLQMELDSSMAQQAYELRQERELLIEQNELLREILNKPVIQDRDIFNANRRETLKFGRRTNKDPYPIYGRA